MIPLVKEYFYNASVAKVWNAITTTDDMKAWYFPQLTAFEPVVGYQFAFRDDNQQYRKEWIVTQVIKNERFAHSWSYIGFPGNSEVIFELFSTNENTRLRITQKGLESFPAHPHFARERFDWGWDNLLGQNLKQLLENK